MADIQRSSSFRNSLKSFRHSHSTSISSNASNSSLNGHKARTSSQSSISTSIISAPVLNSEITPVIYRRSDEPKRDEFKGREEFKEIKRRSQVIVEEEEVSGNMQSQTYQPQHQNRMSRVQGHQRVISSRASTPSMRSPNVSPQLAQPIAFPMTRKSSTSKLQTMGSTRSSLLHAPPMRDVWLDDDGDDSSSMAHSSDDSDCEDAKETKAIRKLKQKRKLLRRFGSKSERKGPHQSTASISAPISAQPLSELKHAPSRSSMIAPQPSMGHSNGSHHSRSSSATSRIMSFIGSSREKDSKHPLKSKISAPTNFVHHKHVDVDYLRGSSSDNRALRAATLQGIVGNSASSASSSTSKSRPTSCLSSSSSVSIPQAVSRQPSAKPGHRHEDSIASVATTNTSAASHAVSTPMTSAAPSPTNLSLRGTSPTNLTPPPAVAIDKKSSVESFGSWNATPNTEFFEQQNWLLSSTPDDADGRYTQAPSPYSCYYQSSKPATAVTTNRPANGTVARRPESTHYHHYPHHRNSMLLPSPKLPVSNLPVPSVVVNNHQGPNEGLGIGPLPENSSKILYEEKQDEDGFQWF